MADSEAVDVDSQDGEMDRISDSRGSTGSCARCICGRGVKGKGSPRGRRLGRGGVLVDILRVSMILGLENGLLDRLSSQLTVFETPLFETPE